MFSTPGSRYPIELLFIDATLDPLLWPGFAAQHSDDRVGSSPDMEMRLIGVQDTTVLHWTPGLGTRVGSGSLKRWRLNFALRSAVLATVAQSPPVPSSTFDSIFFSSLNS